MSVVWWCSHNNDGAASPGGVASHYKGEELMPEVVSRAPPLAAPADGGGEDLRYRIDQVLGRLDGLGQQLDDLRDGQGTLETCISQLHQDFLAMTREKRSPTAAREDSDMGPSLLETEYKEILAHRSVGLERIRSSPRTSRTTTPAQVPPQPLQPLLEGDEPPEGEAQEAAASPLQDEVVPADPVAQEMPERTCPMRPRKSAGPSTAKPSFPAEEEEMGQVAPEGTRSAGRARTPQAAQATNTLSRTLSGWSEAGVTEGELRGFWAREEYKARNSRSTRAERMSMSAPSMVANSSGSNLAKGACVVSPMHPDSWKRGVFDSVSLLVLLYDSIIIPYQFAWFIPFTGWMAAVSWVTACFWLVDFLMDFMTGYEKGDRVVLNPGEIAKRYLKTTFVPNLVVLMADVMSNILAYTGHSEYISWVRLLRLLKLIRVMRLSKMFRTGKVAQMGDHIVTIMRQWDLAEQFNFLTSVVKLVFSILWVNHVGACLWFSIGDSAYHQWVQANNPEDSGQFYEYVMSVYWSASSTIAGESVMAPTNSLETVVTTLFVMFGFMFSSILISSLLATVMAYQDGNKEMSDKLKTLRQFLYQNKVVSSLSVPIQKQVNDRIIKTKRLSEKDVAALASISPLLRSELRYCIYGPKIEDNAFIRMASAKRDTFLKDICYYALDHAAHNPGCRIFEPGTEALGAHYTYWGKLDYLPVPQGFTSVFKRMSSRLSHGERLSPLALDSGEVSNASPPVLDKVGEGSWICPMALWVHWLHRGWLEASGHCELLTVQANAFGKLLRNHPELVPMVQDYSEAVLAALQEEHSSELTDIHTNVTHYGLLSALPLETRMQFSRVALSVLERRQWAGRLFMQEGLRELKNEVEQGDCDLVLGEGYRVHRMTSIAALNLERPNGAVLLQIAKCQKGETIVSCVFPGTKLHRGEQPREAVQRLLHDKLGAWAGAVELRSCVVDKQEKLSKKYGVASSYMRTLYYAEMDDQLADEGIVFLTRSNRGEQANCLMDTVSSRQVSLASMLTDQNSSISRIARRVNSYEAFVFTQDMERSTTIFIYAWVEPEDVQKLTAPEGEQMVQKWVSELTVDAVERASLRG